MKAAARPASARLSRKANAVSSKLKITPAEAARQFKEAGCDAVVYYLGNFSPEIEDAFFVKLYDGPVMLLAAAEESGATLLQKRGDALCGLLSAALAVSKRGFAHRVHIPELPVVSAEEGVKEIAHFIKVIKVVKGTRNATLGLFGPRPRDFETCNYNLASVNSIGIEVEELGCLIFRTKSGGSRNGERILPKLSPI